jgi:hypothetical protein
MTGLLPFYLKLSQSKSATKQHHDYAVRIKGIPLHRCGERGLNSSNNQV